MKQFTLDEMAQVLPEGNKKEQLLNLESLRVNLFNPILKKLKTEDVELIKNNDDEQAIKGEAVYMTAGTFSDTMKLYNNIKNMFVEFDRLGYYEVKDEHNKRRNYVSISYQKGRNRNQLIVEK